MSTSEKELISLVIQAATVIVPVIGYIINVIVKKPKTIQGQRMKQEFLLTLGAILFVIADYICTVQLFNILAICLVAYAIMLIIARAIKCNSDTLISELPSVRCFFSLIAIFLFVLVDKMPFVIDIHSRNNLFAFFPFLVLRFNAFFYECCMMRKYLQVIFASQASTWKRESYFSNGYHWLRTTESRAALAIIVFFVIPKVLPYLQKWITSYIT